MDNDIERKLFGESTIMSRLDELAADLTEEYRGRELTVVAILSGSLIFAADLVRRIELPLQLETISVASYHGGTESTGVITFKQLALPDLRGRHVLIMDDILDSGLTLHAVCERLRAEGEPLSVKVCVLLQKVKQRTRELQADYVGFDIADEFVVGYGLDFRERYRNLPYIGTLRKEKQR